MKRESEKAGDGWRVLLLVACVGLAYGPLHRAGFIWDDDTLLTGSRLIRASNGLYRFWFTRDAPDYWPVSATSLWVEWRLWGMQALGYHLTNVTLHAVEALMVWGILRRLAVPGAYLAALIFAVHPVNVESVAWIAQRKSLLAMVFYLASIACFLKSGWLERAAGPKRVFSPPWYGLSLAAFVMAMLSKGSVAMLPVVLFGLILWRRKVEWGDILKLIPYGLAGVLFVEVDMAFQNAGSGGWVRHAGFVERVLGAGAAVWFYAGKALMPLGLSFVYPQWTIRASDPRWWLPLVGAMALSGWLARAARRGGPGWRGAASAWEYFCVSLVPVMGFTDVYFMKYSLVADHYEYVANIGLIALAAGWLVRLRGGWRIIPAGVVGALMGLSWSQCGIYRDSETLFRSVLARNPGCWMAENNLGAALQASGRNSEALEHYRRAAGLMPSDADIHNNLGNLLQESGRIPEAMAEYRRALEIRPDYAEAENGLGGAFQRAGDDARALLHYRAALRIDPDYPEAHRNLGTTLIQTGRLADGILELQAAVDANPYFLDARYDLGNALLRAGRVSEAADRYEAGLRLTPDDPQLHNNLGVALCRAGRVAEGIREFEAALRLEPDYADARNNLAKVRAVTPGVGEAP